MAQPPANLPAPPRPSVAERIQAWLRRAVVSLTSGRAAGHAAGMLVLRDSATLFRAADVIASSGDPRAIPFLLQAGRDNLDAAGAVRKALSGIGKPSVDPLLRLLTEPELRLRDLAADTLGDIGDPRATRALADIAESDAIAMSLRRTAVNALSKLDSAEAREIVGRIARTGEPSLRDFALFELTVRQFPGAVDALADALRTGAPPLRTGAAFRSACLFAAGVETALPVVFSALDDPVEGVRRRVLDGIDPKSPKSVSVLARALRDPCYTIRGQALDALHGLEWSPTTLEERALVALSSRDGIDREPPPDASFSPVMLDLAEDLSRRGDDKSRERASEALGWVGGDRALDALVRLLGDASVVVQTASIRALARIGTPRALAEVARGVSDMAATEVFATAAHVLGATGDLRWAPILAEAYAGIDPNTGDPRKWAAAEGLLACGDPRPAVWLLAVTADEEWAAEAVRLLELALKRAADRLDEDILDSLARLSGVVQRTRLPGNWDEEDRVRAGLPESEEVPCDEVQRLAREAQSRRRESS